MEFIFNKNNTSTPTNSGLGMTDFTVNNPIKKRRPVTSVDEIQIEAPRKRRRSATKPAVKYVSGVKRKSTRRASSRQTWSWQKVGWVICGALFLRLIFMESGVIDFYNMEDSISEKQQIISLTQKENKELMEEIHKIRTSPRYQRKVAREHLGVIAPNEYLVIFSKDS